MASDGDNFLILLVDDDVDDQYFMRTALKLSRLPIELRGFADGSELLDYMQQSIEGVEMVMPGIIFLDINMPVKDGIDTLIELKSKNEYCHIPVVVYTTSCSERDIEKMYKAGANSYIVKPADIEGVCEMLNSIYNYWCKLVILHKA